MATTLPIPLHERSAPAEAPRLVGGSDWIEPFIRAELMKADGPSSRRARLRRLHLLVDATAASLDEGVPA